MFKQTKVVLDDILDEGYFHQGVHRSSKSVDDSDDELFEFDVEGGKQDGHESLRTTRDPNVHRDILTQMHKDAESAIARAMVGRHWPRHMRATRSDSTFDVDLVYALRQLQSVLIKLESSLWAAIASELDVQDQRGEQHQLDGESELESELDVQHHLDGEDEVDMPTDVAMHAFATGRLVRFSYFQVSLIFEFMIKYTQFPEDQPDLNQEQALAKMDVFKARCHHACKAIDDQLLLIAQAFDPRGTGEIFSVPMSGLDLLNEQYGVIFSAFKAFAEDFLPEMGTVYHFPSKYLENDISATEVLETVLRQLLTLPALESQTLPEFTQPQHVVDAKELVDDMVELAFAEAQRKEEEKNRIRREEQQSAAKLSPPVSPVNTKDSSKPVGNLKISPQMRRVRRASLSDASDGSRSSLSSIPEGLPVHLDEDGQRIEDVQSVLSGSEDHEG